MCKKLEVWNFRRADDVEVSGTTRNQSEPNWSEPMPIPLPMQINKHSSVQGSSGDRGRRLERERVRGMVELELAVNLIQGRHWDITETEKEKEE